MSKNSKNSKSVDFVQMTTDYSIFKRVEGNRPVNETHVEKLTWAIEKKNMLNLFPIVVDKDMNLIDGQHRLACAKALGLPVYYIVSKDCMNSDDVKAVNISQKRWHQGDYLDHYCERGFAEYLTLKSFYEKNKDMITLGKAVQLVMYGNRASYNADFKNGDLICNDIAYAEEVCLILREMIIHYQTKRPENRFVVAVQNIVGNADFSYERMVFQLKRYNKTFRLYGTAQDQVEIGFNAIYNFRKWQKDEVRLLWLKSGNKNWRPERKELEAKARGER